MRSSIRFTSAALAILAASCVLVMLVLTGLDIGIRWTTGRSLAGAQEVTEQLMVAVVYLGMAFALQRREHVAVAICTSSLPIRAAAGVRLLGQFLMLALVAWMIWRTGLQAWKAYLIGEVRFGLLQVPVWPARAAIPVGLAAFFLQSLLDAADRVRAIATGSDDQEHQPVQSI